MQTMDIHQKVENCQRFDEDGNCTMHYTPTECHGRLTCVYFMPRKEG